MTLCGCACHIGVAVLCACTVDTCPVLNRPYLEATDSFGTGRQSDTRNWSEGDRDDDPPVRLVLPTCDRCGGIGHTTTDTVPISVLEHHRDELRAMAKDIRQDHQPIGSSLGIARQARADAYEDMVRRIERDIQGSTR